MAIGVNYELIYCCRNSIDIKIVIFFSAIIKMLEMLLLVPEMHGLYSNKILMGVVEI
jgi:hypothetical protein